MSTGLKLNPFAALFAAATAATMMLVMVPAIRARGTIRLTLAAMPVSVFGIGIDRITAVFHKSCIVWHPVPGRRRGS